MKPFSESCVNNQAEICAVLDTLLVENKHVLEIGSGTGQHAVYFSKRLPHLIWQTSDQEQYHQGINLWLDEAKLDNARAPIRLDVSRNSWPELSIDALFSANAVHIMSWNNVIDYFTYGAQLLEKNGLFILYGPFNYNDKFTSESNANFDQWLKDRDPASGVRDFEALDELANKNNMIFKHDIEMAVNNRILCWAKK
ncbi:MAG: DUF938 domain-containing protein [Cocleimonas sp.]